MDRRVLSDPVAKERHQFRFIVSPEDDMPAPPDLAAMVGRRVTLSLDPTGRLIFRADGLGLTRG